LVVAQVEFPFLRTGSFWTTDDGTRACAWAFSARLNFGFDVDKSLDEMLGETLQ
jgi:hypothetical protein